MAVHALALAQALGKRLLLLLLLSWHVALIHAPALVKTLLLLSWHVAHVAGGSLGADWGLIGISTVVWGGCNLS